MFPQPINLLRSRSIFVVSCCQFLKAIILKTINEIVLAFLPVQSKTNILYVNMNFTGKLLFRFGGYCGKVFPEPAVSHPIFSTCTHKECSFNIFFKLKKFKKLFISFETINFNIFFIKMSCFRSNLETKKY